MANRNIKVDDEVHFELMCIKAEYKYKNASSVLKSALKALREKMTKSNKEEK